MATLDNNTKLAEFWQHFCTKIQTQLSSNVYRTWIEPMCLLSIENSVLKITLPNLTKLDWARKNYAEQILILAKEYFALSDLKIEFVLPNTAIKERKEVQTEVIDTEIEQLPLFPQSSIAISNVFARTALFGSTVRREKWHDVLLDNKLLGSQNNIELLFSGQPLNQYDGLVFSRLINLLSGIKPKEKIEFSMHDFLCKINASGYTPSDKDYKRLRESLERLTNAKITVRYIFDKARFSYIGHLLTGLYIEEPSENNKGGKILGARIDPKIAQFFIPTQYSLISQEEIFTLHNNGLAMWLYQFYSTHKDPYPIKFTTLYTMSKDAGMVSDNTPKVLKEVKRKIKTALQLVENATGWVCYLNKEGMVYIGKNYPMSLT